MKPQTLTPDRFFQLSPAHVSLNFSPARGIEWNVHTSLPVWMSHARTSPAGPRGGFSCVRPPVMIRLLYIDRRRAEAVRAGQALQNLRRVQVDDCPGRRTSRSARRSWRRASRVGRRSVPNTICGGVSRSPANTRRRASTDCRSAAERPTSPCRSSDRARRRGRTASRCTSRRSMTSGVVSLGEKPEPPRPRPRPCLQRAGAVAAPPLSARRRRPHVVHPRDLQLIDVGRRDLRQRRESHAARIVPVGRPLVRRRGGLGGQRPTGREAQDPPASEGARRDCYREEGVASSG